MKSSLPNFISIIKLCIARRKLTAKVPFSNLNLNILKILYSEGYIRGYRVSTTGHIFVFFKQAFFKPSLLDMAFFCPKNKFSIITYQKVVRFYGLKNFGIVSTHLGLLTLEQCFLYKVGGILILLVLR